MKYEHEPRQTNIVTVLNHRELVKPECIGNKNTKASHRVPHYSELRNDDIEKEETA